MGTAETRESWAEPPVPQLTPKLAWWQEAELLVLNKVVGPWRRRRTRRQLPPPLTAEETARRLFTLPVSYWTYDFEPGVRHVGPMSQDFAAAFGLGNTNRKIHMVDANGVAVLAIQVLNRRLTALQREVERLSALVAGNDEETAGVSAGEHNDSGSRGSVGTAPAGTRARRGPHMDTDRTEPEDQDTEGHRIYSGSDRNIKHDITPVPTDEDENVEGHRYYTSDQTTKHDITPVATEDDDTAGHRLYGGSDRNIKHDITPVPSEEGDDAEGHRYSTSDENTKHDITPVLSEEADET